MFPRFFEPRTHFRSPGRFEKSDFGIVYWLVLSLCDATNTSAENVWGTICHKIATLIAKYITADGFSSVEKCTPSRKTYYKEYILQNTEHVM